MYRESAIDRWIPLTKGQLCRKRFYVMTSSCPRHLRCWPAIHGGPWSQSPDKLAHVTSIAYQWTDQYFVRCNRVHPRNYKHGSRFGVVEYRWHDDVIKWKHFPRYWPFVREIHRSPVNSPHKGQWGGALMFSLICAWTNGWTDRRDTGDLRCHCAHYDAIVMISHKLFKVTSLTLGQSNNDPWNDEVTLKNIDEKLYKSN